MLSIANQYYHRLNDYPFHTAPDSGCRTPGSSSYPENDPSQQYASRSLQLNSVYSAPQPSYSLHHIHNSDLHPDLSRHLAFGQHTRLKDMIGRTTEVTCAPLQVIPRIAFCPIVLIFESCPTIVSFSSSQSGYSTVSGGGCNLYSITEDLCEDGCRHSSLGTSGITNSSHESIPCSLSIVKNPASDDRKSKVYSFVAHPGYTAQKRPRRRYEEIERLYVCDSSGCEKAYGTLNQLNM